MDELFKKFLSGLVDTAVTAGVTSLVTDVSFKDAFKVTAGTNVLGAVLGGGSPLDLFSNKQAPAAPPASPPAGAPAADPNALLRSPPTSVDLIRDAQRRAGTAQGQAGQKQGALTALPGQVNTSAFNLPTSVGQTNLTAINPPPVPLAPPAADTRGIMESFGDVVSGDGGRMNALKQLFAPDKAGNPSALRSYSPALLALIAAGKGLGAFDKAEIQRVEPYGGLTSGGLMTQNSSAYRPGVPSRGYAQGGGISNLEAFPRRNGGIAGPGTATSDEIPAMLSDGEFVMTEAAVRGMGKGNRERGIQNMYQVMNNLESRVA